MTLFRAGFALLAALVLAAPARADWGMQAAEVGGVFWGAAESGAGFSVTCAAYPPGAAPIRAEARAVATAPDAVRVILSTALAGPGDSPRDDLMVVAGPNGYLLPPAEFDPETGWWATVIGAGDAMFPAIAAEQEIRVRSDSADTAISARGFAAVYRTFVSTCSARFGRTGADWTVHVPEWDHAQSAATASPMRDAAAREVAQFCGSDGFLPDVMTTDFDRDGTEDIVLDWSLVDCPAPVIASRCTATGCPVLVFLSGLYPALGNPASLFDSSDPRLGALSDGTPSLTVLAPARGLTTCRAEACDQVWTWNGAAFSPLPE
ncbi:hypothetical protein HKCCE2091_18705 [Rhodobacterales bacterium HKCCE2091]|nr:hypothetical protein [Rhodobacterales bacterium HKCCE2091]